MTIVIKNNISGTEKKKKIVGEGADVLRTSDQESNAINTRPHS